MLRFGLSFLLGLLFVYTGSGLPAIGTLLLVAGLVTAISIFLRRNSVMVLAGFATGLLLGWQAANDRLQDRLDPELQGEILLIEGRVASLVDTEAGRQRFLFTPDDSKLPRLLRLTVYREKPEFRAGERWQLAVKLREARGFSNPAGFDIECWYFREGIGATGYVRSEPVPVRQSMAAGWLAWREQVLHGIAERTERFPNAGLIRALAAGDRRTLDESDWQLLRETGTSHLVAISGLHLSLLALLLAASLRFVLPAKTFPGRRGRWLKLLLLEAGISTYALLAGLDTPVQRAWVMVSLGLLALGLARRFRWSAIYGVALTIVLALDPLAPLDAGFWLSFGAVAAILFSMGGRVRQRAGWLVALDVQWRLSLLLTPLTLAAFQLLAPASLAANIVAIPFTGFVLLPVLLFALLTWPVQVVSEFLFELAALGFDWQLAWLTMLATTVPARTLQFSLPELSLLASGILLLLLPGPFRLRGLACVTLLVSSLLLWMPEHADLRDGDWRITALDVGQGTAVLIQTRTHLAVYDTGPAFRGGSAAESVVAPVLRAMSGKPELIIISHRDNDHAGGLDTLRKEFPDASLLMGESCAAGLEWTWDEVVFRVEHPQPDAYWSSNNGSCVLRISGRHSALLTGDIESAAEASLVRGGLQPADVVLAPHHGSRTSSMPAFVKAISPGLVIFPAGFANRWGFPRQEVRERWLAAGAQTWTTGLQGAITVTSGKRDLDTQRWRKGNPRIWRYPPVAEAKAAGHTAQVEVR